MNEASIAAAAALQLPDEAFYSHASEPFDGVSKTLAPVDPPSDAATATHEPEPAVTPVFALGLPRVVSPERGVNLPVAVAVRYGTQRQWEVDFRQNLWVALVDLRTGLLRTVAPFKPTKRLASPPTPSRSGPPPSEQQRRITMRGVERVELRPVFGEDWPSAAFAVTAFAYDWASNTKVIERHPAPAPAPEAVAAPSHFLQPAVAASSSSPVGLSVSLPATGAPGGPLLVHGSVSAAASSVTLVRSEEEPKGPLMVAHLLIVRLDSPQPFVIDLGIPVSLKNGNVSASFSFDLGKRPGMENLTGANQVYLVSGRTVVGPSALTIGPH